MRNKTKQDFYLYYILEDSKFNFLYCVRNCKRPEQTKEYKKLRSWMYRNLIKSSGYCTKEYFEDYQNKFISPNLTYLKIN